MFLRKTYFLGVDSKGIHQSALRGAILMMSEKFQSHNISTQMRIKLTRAISALTLEGEIRRGVNSLLLNPANPVAKTDGTLSLSTISQ